MIKLKIRERVAKVVSKPTKYDYEQFGLYLLNSKTYRLLWDGGYIFCFDDESSHMYSPTKLEVIPFMMISGVHYCKIGEYKKFALVDADTANLVFDNRKDGELNDIVFPIIKAKDMDYAIITESIKEHEAKNAKQRP